MPTTAEPQTHPNQPSQHIMPAKVYTDKDADLGLFKNKTIAVLGYGSQGHAHALNLKDSAVKVIIGLYEGSKSAPVAKKHGFTVVYTAEACRQADDILPRRHKTKQANVYQHDIQPKLTNAKPPTCPHGLVIPPARDT